MSMRAGDVAAAVAGVARYKAGRALLRLKLRASQALPPVAAFESGWRFVLRNRWLFRGREAAGNRYQIDWRNFAFMSLLDLLDRRGKRPVPVLEVVNEEVLTEAPKERGFIVATIHSRVEYVMNRVIEERGIDYVVIAISDLPQRASELLGLRGQVTLIPLDSDSLLIARKHLRAGRAVCTCVDFTVREPGTLYHGRYIDPYVFRFALQQGAGIVFAFTGVTDEGTVRVILSRPRIDPARASAETIAADFLEFIQEVSSSPAGWKIGPWSIRMKSGRKQHDNFWVRRSRDASPRAKR